MKIEVKDKYTGKNIKEPNSEIPDLPMPKPELTKRHRKIPLGFIITIVAIISVIAGLIFAILMFTKKSELVGTWIRENNVWTYEFKEDGTGSYGLGFGTPILFHYKDNGDHIEITYDKNGNVSNFDYHFEDDKLIIKNQLGENQTYQRKGSENESKVSSPNKSEVPVPKEPEEPSQDETEKSFLQKFKDILN